MLVFLAAVTVTFLIMTGKRFAAPSVLHAMDRLGRETVVTPGSAQTTETDFEGARLSLLAGNSQQSMHPSLDGGL